MALAHYTHHASRGQSRARAREELEHATHSGLRAQKTPPPGERPGVLKDPELQGGAVTDGYVAAPAPPLAVPLLASAAGEAVDHSTLQFLLTHAIETKKALEEEERLKRVQEAVARLRAKVHAGEPLSAAEHEAWYGTSSSSTGKRRKKKKRRRKKLPKAPLPRCGAVLGQGRCARVVQRQVRGSMVQQTVVVPQLHFIDGRRHSLTFRRSRSSWSSLFSESLRFRRYRSFFGGRCPCCAGRADSQVPPWRRSRFFFCRQAQMICIMAGMAQKDSYAATQLCLAGFAGDDTARAVFPDRGLDVPLCATSGAGRDCAQLWSFEVAVHPAGETSTEASGRIFFIFYVYVYLVPRRGNLDIISTSSIFQFRQLQRLLEEFLVFLYVKVDSFLEVDFGLVPARLQKEIWTVFL